MRGIKNFGLLIVVATLVVAMANVNCGGGNKSLPLGPTGTPTPTPVPVQTSISFVSATPDCGSTIPRKGTVKIRVYIVASPGDYSVAIGLFDASGNRIADSVSSGSIVGTGNYDLVLSGPNNNSATSATLVLILQPLVGSTELASQTFPCGFVWQ